MLVALAIVVAAAIAFTIGHFAMPIGTAFGLLDFPDEDGGRKRHAQVTPLVGGLALTAASVGTIALTAAFAPEYGPGIVRHLMWLGVAVAAMFVIGVADDRFLLSVRIRLGVAMLMLSLVIADAPDFGLAFLRFSGQSEVMVLSWGAPVLTLLCLVGLLNAVNMADGKNGIVIALGLIWSLILLLRLPATMQPAMAATATALVVLFGYNMRNRLFLGDGGSYALSTLFGLLAVYAYNHDFANARADDIALMFAIPVFDTVRLLVGRTLQRRSPFHGGRDHLHHYLFARVGWPAGLWIYVALVALPNAGAVAFPGTALAWLLVTLLAYALVLRHARAPRIAAV